MELQPFRIEVPDADLIDLKSRLAATRWPDQLPSEPWARGVPVEYLRELAAYWADGFDWRAQEAELNSSPSSAPRSTARPSTFCTSSPPSRTPGR